MVMSVLNEFLTLPADPTAAHHARKCTTRLCTAAGLDSELADTAVLLTSEVVTNAVLHGRSAARLTVTCSKTGVRVEVGDDNSRRPVLHAPHDLDALNGRGMYLLDACATAWGVLPDPFGKIVWFEIGMINSRSRHPVS